MKFEIDGHVISFVVAVVAAFLLLTQVLSCAERVEMTKHEAPQQQEVTGEEEPDERRTEMP